MKKPIAFLLPLALTACASAGTTARPAAPPLPATPAPTPATVPEVWQNLDLALDGVPGTSTERALAELLANRRPARTVVVAVIDGGVDTAHVDLVDALWRNPDETAGNGRDDDGNGYVDDVYGWNFIGAPDGRNVDNETLEVTRLFRLCRRDETPPTSDCGTITRAFEEERTEAAGLAQQVAQIQAGLATITPMLREAAGTEELTDEVVRGIETSDPRLQQARDAWLQLSAADITAEYLEEVGEDVQAQLEYNLDPEFDPRGIVGDDLADGDERVYGNRDVMGPDAEHGTHVAGIIAAARNGMGNDGIAAPNVRIMAVRAVPNGDERDKDVANAIRYAVDEGAHIINMSFGKSFSPRKHLVDAAVRYAEEHGVLLIHAAGNDGQSLETADNFPNPDYEDGGRAARWLTIGASGWKVDSLAAPFSNYGPTKVDLFAPGVEILSTAPGGEWERNDGTSMAAPVVTGVAALLMAYFPDLDADDVKEILLASAVRHADRMVPVPGEPSPTGEPRPAVRFGTLSVTGAVVNSYEAVRLALERSGG